jgi:3-isopropylmalate/(R)-2-methylmalate dehydratase small subunit
MKKECKHKKDIALKAKGSAFSFGDNIDTDVIIPARYLTTSDPGKLAGHCMEDIDPTFVEKIKSGDIIVAGHNFGCGSSREHAPIAIKACGVSCIIASSFARIFYRNSINIGLPIFECEEAARNTSHGDEVEVEIFSGRIHNLTTHQTFKAHPFPEFIREIMKADGLINFSRNVMAKMKLEGGYDYGF